MLLKEGYEIIVRPHPETIKRSPRLVNNLAVRFQGNPDFTLERSVATDDSLMKSDILICDCSGVALEYAFGTERPVLFLDVPPKVKNKDFKELGIEPLELLTRSKIGVIIPPEEVNTVPRAIKELKATQQKYKEAIVSLREQYIYNFGTSSEVGAKYIMSLLDNI